MEDVRQSMEIASIPATRTTEDQHVRAVVEGMRVLIVGGISAGVLIVGVGSRVAMFVLRITSSDSVHGVKSDDGFIIGQVTLGGTYNLLQLGAAVGIIGAGVYMMVAPWLLGPTWFRRLTTGLAAAAVAGSALVHADGTDFTLLKPKWLAIGLFVALPGLFGALIGSFVDAVRRPGSWTSRGRRRWIVPLVCVACFPVTVLPLLFAAIVLILWAMASAAGVVRLLRKAPAYAIVVRSLWLFVAVAGLVALVNDIDALT
jgi:hypothetical protein